MKEQFKLISSTKIPCGHRDIYESDMFRYDCQFFTGSLFQVYHKETGKLLCEDGFRIKVDKSIDDALNRIEREVIRKFFF